MMDTVPADAGNRESNEVVDAINNMSKAVQRLDATRHGVLNLLLAQPMHVRARAIRLVFAGTAAGAVTFTFGGLTFVYQLTATQLTLDVPAPITILDRGTAIGVATAAGALSIAYLTYLPE